MSGIKAKRKQLVRKTLMRAKAQGERAAEQRQELPEEYDTNRRCSRAFPMWLPVQATPPKAPPASATASFVRCRRSGKISPCRAAPNLHQNRLKKRKSLFPRRPSAGKCSKRSASGKRPSQPKHQRRKPRCRHRPHRHRRLTKPKCSST